MRRLRFYLILTADGMYAQPDGGLDHYHPAEDEHQYAKDIIRDAGAIVYGRVMYDVMTYWDSLDVDDASEPAVAREFAELWQATPKLVVSRGTPTLGPNATVVEGDVVEAVRRLKAEPGPELSLGCGAELFATLSDAGLIDDYEFLVIPTAIGAGKALFAGLKAPLRLRLTGTRPFDAGSVLHTYVRADAPTD